MGKCAKGNVRIVIIHLEFDFITGEHNEGVDGYIRHNFAECVDMVLVLSNRTAETLAELVAKL